MNIDDLIKALEHAKTQGLEEVKILRKEHDFDYTFCSENIIGFSYDYDNDDLILFPEYI